MHRLPAALLRHTQSDGRHYDLLIADPTRPPAHSHPLWAARVALPCRAWARLRAVPLIPLPHHRQRYLTYQGPISGRRGHVCRVDHGLATPLLWRNGYIIVDLRFQNFVGPLEIRRLSDTRWLARVL